MFLMFHLNFKVVIGEELKISRVKLQRCSSQRPTKLVCDLLGVVFTQREMATSLLTGQKDSAKDEVKPPLEATSVNAIFGMFSIIDTDESVLCLMLTANGG